MAEPTPMMTTAYHVMDFCMLCAEPLPLLDVATFLQASLFTKLQSWESLSLYIS